MYSTIRRLTVCHLARETPAPSDAILIQRFEHRSYSKAFVAILCAADTEDNGHWYGVGYLVSNL